MLYIDAYLGPTVFIIIGTHRVGGAGADIPGTGLRAPSLLFATI